MNYAEQSFAGPDAFGRVFEAYQFHHIGVWQHEQRLKAIKRSMIKAFDRLRK